MTAPPPPPPQNPLVPIGGTTPRFDLQVSIVNALLRAEAEVIKPGYGTDRLHIGLTEAEVEARLGPTEETLSLDELLESDEFDAFFGVDQLYRRHGVTVTFKDGLVSDLKFHSGFKREGRGKPFSAYPAVIEPDLPLASGRDEARARLGAPGRTWDWVNEEVWTYDGMQLCFSASGQLITCQVSA